AAGRRAAALIRVRSARVDIPMRVPGDPVSMVEETGKALLEMTGRLMRDKAFTAAYEVASIEEDAAGCDVLLMTTTSMERDAVLGAFKGITGATALPRFGKVLTYYDLGLVGGARILMVQSEMGSTSPGSSLSTALTAMDELAPRAVVM